MKANPIQTKLFTLLNPNQIKYRLITHFEFYNLLFSFLPYDQFIILRNHILYTHKPTTLLNKYNYCNFQKMFQGQRLQYVVPGYTGHIPHKVYEDNVPLQQKNTTGKIPGYAGYVKGIKPQNIYGNTFGKITLNVAQQSYIKGQDVDSRHKYVSTQQQVNIPPSQMLQRTAADIVGVPNKKVVVQPPANFNVTGNDVNQFTLSQSESFRQKIAEQKANQFGNSKTVLKDGKQYVKLDNPIPGYTGFARRVMANNIFGKTFADSMKQSENDTSKLLHEKQRNFNTQLNTEPPLKF